MQRTIAESEVLIVFKTRLFRRGIEASLSRLQKSHSEGPRREGAVREAWVGGRVHTGGVKGFSRW